MVEGQVTQLLLLLPGYHRDLLPIQPASHGQYRAATEQEQGQVEGEEQEHKQEQEQE